jgi:putative aldouronate transport system permease protein
VVKRRRIRESPFSLLFDSANVFFMFLLVVVMAYPFVYVAVASLSTEGYVTRGEVYLWPRGFTTEPYELVLSDPWIGIGYWNTVKYTVAQTVVTVTCTSLFAYPLSKKRLMARRPILLFVGFTMLFNGGLIPNFLLVKYLGLYNNFWALIVPGAINTFYFFVMRTFFEAQPPDLEEAALMDGAGTLRVFLSVVVPLSRPVFATVALFTAVAQWNAFFGALIYLTDKTLYPLQIHLRNIVVSGSMAARMVKSGEELEEGLVLETIKYATIMVATIPIVVVYPFVQKYFVKGAMIGSIKG